MTLVKRPLRTLGAAAVLLLTLASPALAGPKTPTNSTTWTGRGTTSDGAGGRTLDTTLCAPAAGADAEGTYLLFVLSSTRGISGTPMITVEGGLPTEMKKSNVDKSGRSSFKHLYTSDSAIDLDDLDVSVTWTGSGTPTFTISHGCNDDGEGGDSLTVNFIGEYNPNLPTLSGPVPGWDSLGNVEGNNASIEVCESSTTNCVTFSAGTTPGASRALTLGGPGKSLDVTVTDDFNFERVTLWSSTIAASSFLTSSPIQSGSSFTTTTTYSNGDSVWFAADLPMG